MYACMYTILYTKARDQDFFLNTFIQQAHIIFIKSVNEDTEDVEESFFYDVLLKFLFIKES